MKLKDIILWPTYHPLLSFLWFCFCGVVLDAAMSSGLFPNAPKATNAVVYEWLHETSPALSSLVLYLALPGLIIGPYGTVGFLIRRAHTSKQEEAEPDETGTF